MIELFTRFTVTAPVGTISDAGVAQINALIARQNLEGDDWKAVNPGLLRTRLPPLPRDWEWVWLVSKGAYVGTMPKRVAKYYFKAHGLKCPVALLSEIGNVARAHAADSLVYEFEFVDEFDWEDGDFADGGSCYWGDHAGALQMLKEHGSLAILFYDDANAGRGRAWVVPLAACYVVFNGYGFNGSATLTVARVLALFLDVTYKQIQLTNDGKTHGVLWINGGGGYLVGAQADIAGIDAHDFGWEEIHLYHCARCGRDVGEDEQYRGADDETYCADCFYNWFDTCAECGETYWSEDLYSVGDDMVCTDCLENNYTACENCREYVANHRAQEHQGNHYCEDCYGELETRDGD
jgi:hypothetical protein